MHTRFLACAQVGVPTHTVQDTLLGDGAASSGLSLPISVNTGKHTGQPNVHSPPLRLSFHMFVDYVEWTTEAHQDPVQCYIPQDTHAQASTVNTGDIGHYFHLRRSWRKGPSVQAVTSQNSFHPLLEEYIIELHSSGEGQHRINIPDTENCSAG